MGQRKLMCQQLSFNFDPIIDLGYDGSCPYPELHYYGIIQENSNIRAHVGPVAKCVYVYKTSDMVRAILAKEYHKLPAYQKNFEGVTGYGPVVPLSELNFVIPVMWRSVCWWDNFKEDADTGSKGREAVNVVAQLMRMGRFPFFVIPQEVTDIIMDIKGTDIIVSGKWRIQVKCDWKAGPKEVAGCSGNLFVQTHERNPMSIY